jgi:hypothetical protein
VWVVLEFPNNAAQQMTFHDPEGFSTAWSTRSFVIMAGLRAGAGALVMERLVLRERPFSRPLPRAAVGNVTGSTPFRGWASLPGKSAFRACATPPEGHPARRAAIMREEG